MTKINQFLHSQKIKKLFSYLDALPFSYKTSFLIFIISGGMISIILFSQISLYSLKNDFDLLFEKRTNPIIKLENIKCDPKLFIIKFLSTILFFFYTNVKF